MPKYMYLVKIPLIFKSGKKRLFLYHISTPKGQSVPQFVVQYHKNTFRNSLWYNWLWIFLWPHSDHGKSLAAMPAIFVLFTYMCTDFAHLFSNFAESFKQEIQYGT